jgi:hypothetical protein
MLGGDRGPVGGGPAPDHRFFDEIELRAIDEAEVRRIDPELRSFFNANTPEAAAEARRILDERG